MEEDLQDPHRRDRENCSSLLTNSLADIEGSLQRDAEAAYMHAEVGLPRRVARLEIAAAARASPEGVSGCGPWPRVIFSLAQPTPLPCLRLQPAPRGCRRDVGGSRSGPPSRPPSPGAAGVRDQRRCCLESMMSLRAAEKRWETQSL